MSRDENDMRSIHFRVPRPLYEEFKTTFPETGWARILFTRFMQLAIEGAKNKDCFVESLYQEAKDDAGWEGRWED